MGISCRVECIQLHESYFVLPAEWTFKIQTAVGFGKRGVFPKSLLYPFLYPCVLCDIFLIGSSLSWNTVLVALKGKDIRLNLMPPVWSCVHTGETQDHWRSAKSWEKVPQSLFQRFIMLSAVSATLALLVLPAVVWLESTFLCLIFKLWFVLLFGFRVIDIRSSEGRFILRAPFCSFHIVFSAPLRDSGIGSCHYTL